MHLRGIPVLVGLAAMAVVGAAQPAPAQRDETRPTFRSQIDLVSVSAVVQDHKGRVVRWLSARDFVVTENGYPRPIVALDADERSPAAVLLLVDGSGSMRFPPMIAAARQLAGAILEGLREEQDRAALMSFDTRLLTLRSFTTEFDEIRHGLREIEFFGATSLYDAIAGAAGEVYSRIRQRRAVIVFTDGSDNASEYSAAEVARIASTIDVPVYVFAVGELGEGDTSAQEDGAARSVLADLARATGGDFYAAMTPALAHDAITALMSELHHQYLIAFEPTGTRGLRRLEVRARDRGLRVRARTWYSADGLR